MLSAAAVILKSAPKRVISPLSSPLPSSTLSASARCALSQAVSSATSVAVRSLVVSTVSAVPGLARRNAAGVPSPLLSSPLLNASRVLAAAISTSTDSLAMMADGEDEPLRSGWAGIRGPSGSPVSPGLLFPSASAPVISSPALSSLHSSALLSRLHAVSRVRQFGVQVRGIRTATLVEEAGDEGEKEDDIIGDGKEGVENREKAMGGVELATVDGIGAALKARLVKEGITRLFPVQVETLHRVLKNEDIVVRSRTGSGKTLGFAIPVVEMLSQTKAEDKPRTYSARLPRCLVLAPTRELAKQVEEEFRRIAGPLSSTVIYGGVPYERQQRALSKGCDIVVGTPGRLIDLLNSKTLDLSAIQFAVLDEADEMLRMGFKEDCEKIFAAMPAPDQRQTMLWSATVPSWVQHLASTYCAKPQFVDLVGEEGHKLPATANFIAHTVNRVTRPDVLAAVLAHAVKMGTVGRVLVFTDTKSEAYDLTKLNIPGVRIRSLTGDMSQAAREAALNEFKEGRADVLCATDIAARGLDIPDVDTVVHYRLPQSQEAFAHRSGRTARAGRTGNVVALVETGDWDFVGRWEKSLQFNFAIRVPPVIDAKVLLAEMTQKIASRIRKVPHNVTSAVDASGLLNAVLQAAGGSPEHALRAALALTALGLDASASSAVITTSLISGEKGLTTVTLQPTSEQFEALTKQASPYAEVRRSPNTPVDPLVAKNAIIAVMDACGVEQADRPRRLWIAYDLNSAIVFDVPANALVAIQHKLAAATLGLPAASAASAPLIEQLAELPASVKTVVTGRSSSRSDSSLQSRRGRGGGGSGGGDRRRPRSGGFDRSGGGGGGGDRGGFRSNDRGGFRDREGSGGGFRDKEFSGGDRTDKRPPRPFREDADRPTRRNKEATGGAGAEASFDRPPRPSFGSGERRERSFDGEKPRRSFSDKPRGDRDGDRPFRKSFEDRAPRSFDSDRPPRRFDEGRRKKYE